MFSHTCLPTNVIPAISLCLSGSNKKRNHLNQKVKQPDYKVAYVQLVRRDKHTHTYTYTLILLHTVFCGRCCCLSSISSLTSVQYTVGGGDLSRITPSPLCFFVIVEAALLNTTPRGKGHFGGPKPSAFVSLTIFEGGTHRVREVRRVSWFHHRALRGRRPFKGDLSNSHKHTSYEKTEQKWTSVYTQKSYKHWPFTCNFKCYSLFSWESLSCTHTNHTALSCISLLCGSHTLAALLRKRQSCCRAWGWKDVFGYMPDLLQEISRYGYHLV